MLQSCSTRADAGELCHPRGAAQLPSAGTCATDTSGFLTGADLFHLNTDAESFGIDLNQLAEIDTSIGYVVEDSLAAIALVFNIAYFHL